MDRYMPVKKPCLIPGHMLSKGYFKTMDAELVPSGICKDYVFFSQQNLSQNFSSELYSFL